MVSRRRERERDSGADAIVDNRFPPKEVICIDSEAGVLELGQETIVGSVYLT